MSDLVRPEAQAWRELWRLARHSGQLPPFLTATPGNTMVDALYMGTLIQRVRGVRYPAGSTEALVDSLNALSLVRWLDRGAATYDLAPDAASAFVLTDTRGMTWGDLRFPYDDFVVLLPPDGPLMAHLEDGTEAPLRFVVVSQIRTPTAPADVHAAALAALNTLADRGEKRVSAYEAPLRALAMKPSLWVCAVCEDGYSLHRTYRIPDDPTTPIAGWIDGSKENTFEPHNRHTMRLVCRLLACMTLYLDGSGRTHVDPARTRPVRQRRAAPSGKVEPVGREIKLTLPLRDAARALARADRDRPAWRLARRIPVPGYWRMTVVGHGAAKTKERRWVRPHERGPKDAALTPRTYEVDVDGAPRPTAQAPARGA